MRGEMVGERRQIGLRHNDAVEAVRYAQREPSAIVRVRLVDGVVDRLRIGAAQDTSE